MGNAGTQGILWDEEDMETSLCPPYTPSCNSCCLKNPRTLSRAQTLPIYPQMELPGAEPLAQNPFPPRGRTLQTQSVFLVVDTLWWWLSLSLSWLGRSHRATTALWIVAFTLPKPPEIVLLAFLLLLLLGGFTPKKVTLKNYFHFLHSIEQLLVICLTSRDCQRFFLLGCSNICSTLLKEQ